MAGEFSVSVSDTTYDVGIVKTMWLDGNVVDPEKMKNRVSIDSFEHGAHSNGHLINAISQVVFVDMMTTSNIGPKKAISEASRSWHHMIMKIGDKVTKIEDTTKDFQVSHQIIESAGVRRINAYKAEILNQKIIGSKVYVMINPGENKDLKIQNKVKALLNKLPFPMEKEWEEHIGKSLKVAKLKKTNPDDPRDIFKIAIPTDGEMESIIRKAHKQTIWKQLHNQFPRLESVMDGVYDIENFNLKKWLNFLKDFGQKEFKELSEPEQKALVNCFELFNDDAKQLVKNFTPKQWEGVDLTSFFIRKKRFKNLKERDIPRFEKELSEFEEEDNSVEKRELTMKLEMAKNALDSLNDPTEEIEFISSAVKKAVFSHEDKKGSYELLKNVIARADALMEYFKENPDLKMTRKNIKAALLKVKYKNIRYDEIAELCARANVSQTEFETYQDLWDSNMEARLTSPTRIPTLSGRVGDLDWEMLDQRDPEILVAGNETHCCQTANGIGSACVRYMLQNPMTSTIFKVSRKKSNKYLAQSFVWVDENKNILCFDNIEVDGGKIKEEILACYRDYLEKTNNLPRSMRFEHMTIGTGYSDVDLGGMLKAKDGQKASIPNSLGYSDAKNAQVILG